MFTKHANQELDKTIIFHWLLMSVCAGALNAVAFIGLGTFATHVTGFGTLFGVHLAQFQLRNAVAALAVPIFFLLGAVISGLCVEARVRNHKKPHYDYVMYLCCFLMLLGMWLGNQLNFSSDMIYLHSRTNFVLISLICLASGLMNAAFSYSSRATIRITHLTGATTDLGRGIAELISLKLNQEKGGETELRVNLLRVLTIASFMMGGFFGAFLFQRIFFKTLFFPAVYFAYAGNRGRRLKLSIP